MRRSFHSIMVILLTALFAETNFAEVVRLPGTASTWHFGDVGYTVGRTGMEVATVNGEVEIIVSTDFDSGYTDRWFQVFRWNQAEGIAALDYVSDHFPGTIHEYNEFNFEHKGIGFIQTVDLNEDGKLEMVVGLRNGGMHVYDLLTKRKLSEGKIARFDGSEYEVTKGVVADVDQDGSNELLVLTTTDLLVVGRLYGFPNGFYSVQRIKREGGFNLYVGQLDADLQLEVVFGSGIIYDGSRWTQEWNLASINENLKVLGVHDRDDDGKAEVIVQNRGNIQGYDLETQSKLWEVYAGGSRIGMFQLDADPQPEIVSSSEYRIRVFDSITGTTEGGFDLEYTDFCRFAAADVNGDGKNELIVSSSHDRYTHDVLHVYDLPEDKVIWATTERRSDNASIAVGDVNGDGKADVTYSSGMQVVDIHTQRVIATIGAGGGSQHTVKDLDGDGRDEVITVTDGDGQLGIAVFEWNDLGQMEEIWEKVIPLPEPSYDGFATNLEFAAMDVASLNGDGQMQIVIGVNRTESTFSSSLVKWIVKSQSYVEAISYPSGGTRWRSPLCSGHLNQIASKDFNGDGKAEIAATIRGKSLRVWDVSTNRSLLNLGGDYCSLEPLTNGLAAGGLSGNVSRFVWRGNRFARTLVRRAAKGPINSIAAMPDDSALWLRTPTEALHWPWKNPDRTFIDGLATNPDGGIHLVQDENITWVMIPCDGFVRGFRLDAIVQ